MNSIQKLRDAYGHKDLTEIHESFRSSDLANNNYHKDLLSLIPFEFLRQHNMALTKVTENEIYLAMLNPHDYAPIEHIRARLPESFHIHTEAASLDILNYHWLLQTKNFPLNDERIMEFLSIEDLLQDALAKHTTDVHMFLQNNRCEIAYRQDSTIHKVGYMSPHVWQKSIVKLKIWSHLDIAENRRPQSGSFSYENNKENYDIRASFHPLVSGEKIALRIFWLQKESLDLCRIGFSPHIVSMIQEFARKTSGLILLSGPTGSGKTTTLYAIIKECIKQGKNVSTLEDPVEIKIPYSHQSSINTKIQFDYSEGIKSLLRQDPDVILVGEIRDEITAKMCLRAALTGHLVLSSIHSKCTTNTLLRLMDLGISSLDIAENVLAIISQRLEIVVCADCKGSGCTKCDHKGRRVTPVEETITPSSYGWEPSVLDNKNKFINFIKSKFTQKLVNLDELHSDDVLLQKSQILTFGNS